MSRIFARKGSAALSHDARSRDSEATGEAGRRQIEKHRVRTTQMDLDVEAFIEAHRRRDTTAFRERVGMYKTLFLETDEDLSGALDQMELKRLFERIGETRTHLEIKRLVRQHDRTASGAVTFPDFLLLMDALGAGAFKDDGDESEEEEEGGGGGGKQGAKEVAAVEDAAASSSSDADKSDAAVAAAASKAAAKLESSASSPSLARSHRRSSSRSSSSRRSRGSTPSATAGSSKSSGSGSSSSTKRPSSSSSSASSSSSRHKRDDSSASATSSTSSSSRSRGRDKGGASESSATEPAKRRTSDADSKGSPVDLARAGRRGSSTGVSRSSPSRSSSGSRRRTVSRGPEDGEEGGGGGGVAPPRLTKEPTKFHDDGDDTPAGDSTPSRSRPRSMRRVATQGALPSSPSSSRRGSSSEVTRRKRGASSADQSASVAAAAAAASSSSSSSKKSKGGADDDHKHGLSCLGGMLHSDDDDLENDPAVVGLKKGAGSDHDDDHHHHHNHDHSHGHPHNHDHDHEHKSHEHTAEELAAMTPAERVLDEALHAARSSMSHDEFKEMHKRADLARSEKELSARRERLKEREAAVVEREEALRSRKADVEKLQEDLRTFERVLRERSARLESALASVEDPEERARLSVAVSAREAIPAALDEKLAPFVEDELAVIRAQLLVRRWVMRRRARRLMDLVQQVRACDHPDIVRVRRRNAVMKEIFTSEKTYVESLQSCLDLYYTPIEIEIQSAESQGRAEDAMMSKAELHTVFGDLGLLVLLNQQFLRELDLKINDRSVHTARSSVSEAFQRIAPLLQLYNRYVANFDEAVALLTKLREERPRLAEWLDRTQAERDDNHQALPAYLIMPVQRPMRYDMLLQELIKQTPDDHVDLPELKKALIAVSRVVAGINEHKRAREQHTAFVKQVADEQQQRQARRNPLALGRGLGLGRGTTSLNLTTSGYAGKLSASVHQARGLLAMDANGFSDPYTKLILDEQSRKTKVVKKTLEPVWNEEFAMIVHDAADKLRVEVWDWDRVGANDFIGSVELDVASLAASEKGEEASAVWHKLTTDDGKPAGEVELTLSFVPT